MSSSETIVSLEDFDFELKQLLSQTGEDVYSLIKKKDNQLRLLQADWHVKGVIYHARRALKKYKEFARIIAARASIEAPNIPKADVIIAFTPKYQEFTCEMYALVNLARISLDNLRTLLTPVFLTPFKQMPKSVSDIVEGKTDCPVYTELRENPNFGYLCDFRNCIVHYRTFATNDNAVAVGEHLTPKERDDALLEGKWFDPMVKATFRRADEGVIVNVFLPDAIYQRDGTNKSLANFTYNERINVVGRLMRFVRMVCKAHSDSYRVLRDPGVPTYVFSKK